jgi:predicted RNA-binding protein YlxR (DUF448 family)
VKVKKIPERTCVGCGTARPKRELYRIVRTPEGAVEFDKTGRKPGRGVYICPSRECLESAVRTHRLERSLETQIPQEVFDKLRDELS